MGTKAATLPRVKVISHKIKSDLLEEASVGLKRELVIISTDTKFHTDMTYQRHLNQHEVEKIAADYLPYATRPAILSERTPNAFWIVDGQHFIAGGKLRGEKEILAWVYHDIDIKTEAQLRLIANAGRKDDPLQRFKGQVAAEYPESLAIKDIVESVGTHINETAAHTGLNCVSALEAVYRHDDGVLLKKVLVTLKQALGNIEGEVASRDFIGGMAWFIRQHSFEINKTEFVDRLSQWEAAAIILKARTHKMALGGSLATNLYRAMVEIYNYKRTQKHRLEWRTKGRPQHELES